MALCQITLNIHSLYMLNVVVNCLFQVLNTRNKMSVVSPLTLLLLAALLHGSCAIQCYNCWSNYTKTKECDDPLDTSKVNKTTCPSGMNACIKLKGSVRCKNSSLFPVAASNCHKYTVSQKKQDTKLLPIITSDVNRFSKFFHWLTHW